MHAHSHMFLSYFPSIPNTHTHREKSARQPEPRNRDIYDFKRELTADLTSGQRRRESLFRGSLERADFDADLRTATFSIAGVDSGLENGSRG